MKMIKCFAVIMLLMVSFVSTSFGQILEYHFICGPSTHGGMGMFAVYDTAITIGYSPSEIWMISDICNNTPDQKCHYDISEIETPDSNMIVIKAKHRVEKPNELDNYTITINFDKKLIYFQSNGGAGVGYIYGSIREVRALTPGAKLDFK